MWDYRACYGFLFGRPDQDIGLLGMIFGGLFVVGIILMAFPEKPALH